MTVDTAGPIRGLLGRWIMRFEASSQILSVVFQGTTTVTALSGVLAYAGFETWVPYVLAAGGIAVFIFAYMYTEYGLYNRKNQEKARYGNNFARPDMRIDDEITAAGVFAALHGRPPSEEESEVLGEAVEQTWEKHRNGVDIE